MLICVPLSQGCPSRGRTHKAGHETVLYKSIETMENQDQEEVYIQRYDMESMLQRAVERFVARADISDVNKQLLERFLRDAALGKTVVGSALAEADVARMLDFCRTVEERAIIQVLFDVGMARSRVRKCHASRCDRESILPEQRPGQSRRERRAVEVETGKSDAVRNVRNGLLAGFSRVSVLPTDEQARKTVERQLATARLLLEPRVRVAATRTVFTDTA